MYQSEKCIIGYKQCGSTLFGFFVVDDDVRSCNIRLNRQSDPDF